MADVITGMRQVIQDLVAPDLKALAVKLDAVEKQGELRHEVVMKALEAFRAEMRTEFAMLKLNNQVEVMRQIAPLSERVAILESRTS